MRTVAAHLIRLARKVLATDVVALTKKYDGLPLECDGMTRVLHTVLAKKDVKHKVMVGSVEAGKTKRGIPLHYWIELPDGRIVDYRAQMWLGMAAPHGVFKPVPQFKYVGKAINMPILTDVLFMVLTNGMEP